jgi:hypothetical protein
MQSRPVIGLEPSVEIWCCGKEHVPRVLHISFTEHSTPGSEARLDPTYQAHSIDIPRRKKIPYSSLENGRSSRRCVRIVPSASSADSLIGSYAVGRAMRLRIRSMIDFILVFLVTERWY